MNAGGRPSRAGFADVTVYLQGRLLGTTRVHGGFAPYTFAIPPDLAKQAFDYRDPVQLTLVTPTWNPREVLGAADNRALGVMVDRVAVR
jgi:hypothetical protein